MTKAMQDLIEDFKAVFRPNDEDYAEKMPDGAWPWQHKKMMNRVLEAHFSGKQTVGFKCRERVNYFAIDIDDHRRTGGDGGWDGESPTARLKKMADEVMNRIGVDPSGVFRSNEGVHAYWIMDEARAFKNIHEALKTRLADEVDPTKTIAEHLPTYGHALRVPRPEMFLNNELKKAAFPGFRNLPVRALKEIFGEELEPEGLRAKREAAKAARIAAAEARGGADAGAGAMATTGVAGASRGAGTGAGARTAAEKVAAMTAALSRIEDKIKAMGPIRNGEGNDFYKPIGAMGVRAGLSDEQIIKIICDWADASPGYVGKLKDKVAGKVASTRRRLGGGTGGATADFAMLSSDEGALEFVDFVLGEINKKRTKKLMTRQKQALKEFLLRLWTWKMFLDRIAGSPVEAAAFEDEHPKFRERYQQGYYPVPTVKLTEWAHRKYKQHLTMLAEIGIVNESPYGYKTSGIAGAGRGQCKLYELDIGRYKLLRGNCLGLEGTLRIDKI
jgi:hypothetical protein